MNSSTEITKSAITAALIAAQKAFKPAKKSADNPFFHSRYADLEECWDAVKDALHANGLTIIQPVRLTPGDRGGGDLIRTEAREADGKSLTTSYPLFASVETELRHASGEVITSSYPLVPSKVNDPQAFAAAVTYARRYALMAILGLCPEDDDGETATGRGAGAAKPAATAAAPPRQLATAPPVAAPQGEEFVASGTIEDVNRTEGTTPKGKKYVKCGVKLGGKWYGTFDLKLMDDIEKAFTEGTPVDLTWKQDGKYMNIVNCVVQGGVPF